MAPLISMAMKKRGTPVEIESNAVEKQCEYEFVEAVAEQAEKADTLISLACGIGVQLLAERFPEKRVLPGVNTSALTVREEAGVWASRCDACGDCVLGLTGGICPIARCSKSLLNGPCGGSEAGHCEIDPNVDCAWQLIYDRLSSKDKLHVLLDLQPPKNWRTSRDGGPRKIEREDLRLLPEED